MASKIPSKTPCNKTEVIIIGNGPSGISLSFFLAGHRPYYNIKDLKHPNDILHHKLSQTPDVSIVEQDLEFLCEGLQGRSPNPVSLLLDTLTHADADIGANYPSFLSWKHEETKEIPHIVLGKNRAGGAWQKIDGDMQTLSLSNWMELPSLPFKEWFTSTYSDRYLSSNHYQRARISDLKRYYTDYVTTNKLDKHFHDNCTVTSVRKVYNMRTCIDSESGEIEPCCQNVKKNHHYFWEVRGYRLIDDELGDTDVQNHEEFCFLAPYVVLANGTFDIPNRLHVPGEEYPYVIHTMKEFEDMMKNNHLPDNKSVVVVGAGLTAGDAIMMSKQNNISVDHVFRRSPNDSRLIYHQLPKKLYPEYNQIHEMMRGQDLLVKSGIAAYRPHSGYSIKEFTDDNRVIISNNEEERILHCSCALILIGSKPDLSFLVDDGRNLGIVPKRRIHYIHNPIDINAFSYQSVHEPGLFAVGPLIGDTFVRFVRGGALGVTSHIWRKREVDKS